jgi:FMN-dependent NADH-azoreductase
MTHINANRLCELTREQYEMATLLQINSSLFSDQGNSSALANDFVAQWQRSNPNGDVIIRDLGANPVPHLSQAHVGAFFTAEADRNDAQRALVAESDALIEEVRRADTIVLAVPMYNFGPPSQLKAWFDQLARAGITFRYSENGPVGLLDDKPVIIFAARGGLYAGTEHDHQAPFLKQFLGFIGLTNITFVYAEGVNMGDEAKAIALDQAKARSAELINELKNAA